MSEIAMIAEETQQDPTSADTNSESSETTNTEERPQAAEARPENTELQSARGPRRNTKKRNARSTDRSPRARTKRSGGPVTKPIDRFVVVTWSGQREPVDTMYWAEARRQGEWVVVESLEPVRTRREVLERLTELPSGLAALEFNFSYPQPFLEHLSKDLGDDRWRALLRKVREDLKKNTEDGIRLWIDRIGEYREANLDPEAPPVGRRMDDRRNGGRDNQYGRERSLAPHEQRSKAERFRRADLTIRHAADRHVVSPVQIAYNRLTERYEFNDPGARGRAALLGMSFLDQLLEAREAAAVWPFMMPKPLTVVELQPWIYTRGVQLKADEIRRRLQVLEDAGWDIPSNVRDLAARNPDAERALISLIGIIRTESREDRANRPLRDYSEAFYSDQQVKQEGWYYGVGYRSASEEPRSRDSQSKDKPPARERKERRGNREETRVLPQRIDSPGVVENPIVHEPTAEQTDLAPEVNAADSSGANIEAV
jgi:hypothetical protein